MKIVVIGGSGLVGSKLVDKLRAHGHEAVAASPSSLIRRRLSERHDPREVVTDPYARYFGAELQERTLVPAADARLAETSLDDWLRHTEAGN